MSNKKPLMLPPKAPGDTTNLLRALIAIAERLQREQVVQSSDRTAA